MRHEGDCRAEAECDRYAGGHPHQIQLHAGHLPNLRRDGRRANGAVLHGASGARPTANLALGCARRCAYEALTSHLAPSCLATAEEGHNHRLWHEGHHEGQGGPEPGQEPSGAPSGGAECSGSACAGCATEARLGGAVARRERGEHGEEEGEGRRLAFWLGARSGACTLTVSVLLLVRVVVCNQLLVCSTITCRGCVVLWRGRSYRVYTCLLWTREGL